MLLTSFLPIFLSSSIGCARQAPPEPEETVHLIFDAAFEPPVMLTTTNRPAPQLQVLTLHSQAGANRFIEWYRKAEYERTPEQSLAHPPLGEGITVVTIPVPPERWSAFEREVAASSPLLLHDQDDRYLDGWTLFGEYRHAERGTRLFRHRIYTEQHPLTRAVYRLAADLATDETSRRVAEDLHDLYDSSLPLKQFAGPPLTLRLYSRLSSTHAEALAKTLQSVRANTPVLFDVSNLAGIDPELFPIFWIFLGRQNNVVWWYRSPLRFLREMGVPKSRIFKDRASAVEALQRFAAASNPPPNLGPVEPEPEPAPETIPVPPKPRTTTAPSPAREERWPNGNEVPFDGLVVPRP